MCAWAVPSLDRLDQEFAQPERCQWRGLWTQGRVCCEVWVIGSFRVVGAEWGVARDKSRAACFLQANVLQARTL